MEEEEKQDIHFTSVETLDSYELFKLAEENFEKLNLEDAGYFYEEAIKKEPNDESILISYGDYLMHMNDT